MLKYNSQKFIDICKSNEGFTLLEVIMAVSILTVGLLAVASLQVTAMRGNSMSMEYTESTEKIQDTVEKLMNRDYSHTDLNDTDGDGTSGLDETGANADHSIDGAVYDVYWNIADNNVWDGAAWRNVNGIKTIRIIVKWTERGRPRDYSFDLLRNRI